MTTSAERAAVLRVFPDHTADPVWVDTGMVDLDTLAVSDWLRDELRAWARDWEELMGVREHRYAVVDDSAYRVWRRRGWELSQRLQAELGDDYAVAYTVEEDLSRGLGPPRRGSGHGRRGRRRR
ncbi:hypothetical protein [Terrabacter aeriphilus]|uniref:hypothetical protein n=1 Tax=Terrabacter aeriphilus TaxID=515662 RepID=UPI0031EB90B9